VRSASFGRNAASAQRLGWYAGAVSELAEPVEAAAPPPSRVLRALGRIGRREDDGAEVQLQKALLVASTLMMASLAVLWGALYALGGHLGAAAIPWIYAVLSFASLALFARIRRYALFRTSQLALSLLLPFFLMAALGGFVPSSGVVLWSLTSPLGALVFAGRRQAVGWFAAFVGLVVLGAFLEPGPATPLLPTWMTRTFFVLNLCGVSLVAFVLVQLFAGQREDALLSLDRRQRWIRDVFARYLSPNLVQHLVDHPGELRVGGEVRECTFVLSDLVGFTRLVESAKPERLLALVSEYVDGMIAIAIAHEGTVDRVVGDAVAVMFSAPVHQPDHARRAVGCALAMERFGRELVERAHARGLRLDGIRIGVDSGPVLVGNVGSSRFFDYRALGDAVNTAARLEAANRWLGTSVCVSEATAKRCEGFVGRPVGSLHLRGKRQPVLAFEPCADGDPVRAPRASYEAAFRLLGRDPAAARASFEALLALHPADPLVRLHARRLAEGAADAEIVIGS